METNKWNLIAALKRTLSIGLLLLLTLIGFQNCSPEIQVTDQNAKLNMLNQSATPEQAATPDDPQLEPTNFTPPDPTAPFVPGPGVALLPIQGEWASIAYEDNISSPDAGDRDYNDAVFNYRIAEQFNNQRQLSKTFIEVRLREKLSGNNHILALILDGNKKPFYKNITYESADAFKGSAMIKITNHYGETSELQNVYETRLEVFNSTSHRIGEVIKIEITILQPELNARASIQPVDYKKYRFILSNHGNEKTGIDIAEINSTPQMLSNGNSYPFGFMIPTDWQPPAESQFISLAYPNFELYRRWLVDQNRQAPSSQILNWYLR